MISTEEYINAMSRAAHLHRSLFLSRKRNIAYLIPRHVLAWRMHKDGMSYPKIGRVLKRDHVTVMNSYRLVESAIENPAVAPSFYELAVKYEQELKRIQDERNTDTHDTDSDTDSPVYSGTHDAIRGPQAQER